MRYLYIIIVFFTFGDLLYAAETPDYMAKLRELAAGRPLENSPEARDYLKSLTKVQTLTALRQFGRKMEENTPVEKWSEKDTEVAWLMQFFTEPFRLSDAQLARLSNQTKHKYETGLLPGRLSNEAFNKLDERILDNKEGAFFRYALVRYFNREDMIAVLGGAKKDVLIYHCLTVLRDRESPDVVRSECCKLAANFFWTRYRLIIQADDTVKKLTDYIGTVNHGRNVRALVNTGDVRLSSKTIEQLQPWERRIEDFRKKMAALQKDESEPESLKKEARRHLHWLDRLPLINMQDSDSKPPKD